MLNMNSPVVQNLMQSGFNPYTNSGYIPQPVQQQTYYNPYMMQNQYNGNNNQFEYYYDPMPNVIVNETRGINTQQPIQQTYYNNNYYSPMYNNQIFNGYMNPIMMRNQMENARIQQREEAIQQGKIWRRLLQKELNEDESFDLEGAVQKIESLYYYEPYQEDLSVKDKITIDKNNRVAEIDARVEYNRQNNIQMVSNLDIMRANFYGYYNHINSIIGDIDNCDMMDYFTRVYPQLKQEQLMYEAEKFNKNLKNNYNSKDFNKLIDQAAGERPDSYYYKLMESFADNGVKLETNNGLVITADEMEVKLPERLLKNKQDQYYEQRRKFYDAIFRKEG